MAARMRARENGLRLPVSGCPVPLCSASTGQIRWRFFDRDAEGHLQLSPHLAARMQRQRVPNILDGEVEVHLRGRQALVSQQAAHDFQRHPLPYQVGCAAVLSVVVRRVVVE